MHKLIQATVAIALVIVVSIRETEGSQRVIDHYQRQLNNLQKKINTGKPIVVNGKIKRYKCVEEYVSVDEYGTVIQPNGTKNEAAIVKPRKITTTTVRPPTTTTAKETETKKLTIQHLPNTDSAEDDDSAERTTHKKTMSMIGHSYANEKVEKLPGSKFTENDDDRSTGRLRRKESTNRRFGMSRANSKSAEDEQDEDYEDYYYVEERPVLRRGRNRAFYRRRPAYYLPYEGDVYGKRRPVMRRTYAGNLINDNQDEFVESQEVVQRPQMYQRRPAPLQLSPQHPNAIDQQQIPAPQPMHPMVRTGYAPIQRATHPPLAQPGLFSYMTNRRSIMPTTPASSSFVQGNGIDENAATTPKPQGGGHLDPQKPTSQNCQGIANMAKTYGVSDVQGFIRHNCGLIQSLTMINAPCDVIFNFVDQCYKRKLL